ncbi:MAG: hypothetical protein ACXVCS_02645 [Bdellovibrionota bacterium]
MIKFQPLKIARLTVFAPVAFLLAACGDPLPPRPTPAELAYYYSRYYSSTATSTVVTIATVYATTTVMTTQSH